MTFGDLLAERRRIKDREKFILKLFKLLGVVSFIASAAMTVIVILLQFPGVQERYQKYLTFLIDFEDMVSALGSKWLVVIVIFLLYILRSLTPAYPYMMLYIMTGMVFEPVWSLLINTLGMVFNVTFRYYTGIVMGESWMNRALRSNPIIGSAFEAEGRANPFVLFTLRFVPIIPFNTLSQLYGSFEYPFWRYTLISIATIFPRLVTYSFIGYNVYDPLSVSFFVPLIVLTILSGSSFFLLRGVLAISYKKKPTQTSNEYMIEEKGTTDYDDYDDFEDFSDEPAANEG